VLFCSLRTRLACATGQKWSSKARSTMRALKPRVPGRRRRGCCGGWHRWHVRGVGRSVPLDDDLKVDKPELDIPRYCLGQHAEGPAVGLPEAGEPEEPEAGWQVPVVLGRRLRRSARRGRGATARPYMAVAL